MLMGVNEFIFDCIGQEAQKRSKRLEGGNRGRGRREGGRPCLMGQVSCL